jgi:gamma-glutamyltranspeptidase/glutathione hydrolase
MTLEDLKNHTTTPVTPIKVHYAPDGGEGVTLHETPPNGQGLTALIGSSSFSIPFFSPPASSILSYGACRRRDLTELTLTLSLSTALGIIEQIHKQGKVDLSKVEHLGVEWFHTLISAIRLAFADTRAYIADPEHVRVPVDELLSPVRPLFPLLFDSPRLLCFSISSPFAADVFSTPASENLLTSLSLAGLPLEARRPLQP